MLIKEVNRPYYFLMRRQSNSNRRRSDDEHILSNIIGTSLKSPQTIINKVYDKIGFNAIQDEELRHLVASRICSPMSKKATADYLRRHFKEDVSLQKIYRYLDKLYNTKQELVQAISVEHTRELFGGNLVLLFYDVTTLYFETTEKDELRESGFSKDGKNSNPQVVLGLLVSRGCYPLSYSLFNGSQYEGYTMIPIVDDFVQRFYDERAKKNAHDRDEGVMRLRKRYTKGTLTKADINKLGYNKFLSVSSGVTVSIDDEKIKKDAIWDGHSVSPRERWMSDRCSTLLPEG